MPFAKWSIQGLWFYRTPSLTLAIGPPSGRTMVSPARRLNLDDITPPGCTHNQPLDSSGRSQNTDATVDEISVFFNDAYTTVKNMGEGSTARGGQCVKKLRI